ncbi:MAG: OPT/YSL family transporter, partial [Clostridia bacterium]|nr:OPT/YSL family transporter [Clostridia bacterium]
VVFGFFFATVSSRMVGLVGSSNNPVSGMAIATLLITTAIFKATGNIGYAGMASAISVGTIICIIAAMAGDTSQDLKTGYIVGATPIKQQIGELGGALIAAVAIGGVMYLLDAAWGFGGSELPAPQATLMKLVVEGVMGGTLPWGLVIAGAAVAIVVEILGLPILPIAIGLYLPIHLSVPIFAGGLLREFFERKKNKTAGKNGVLFSSGLIAGEGLIGIALAVFAIVKIGDKSLGEIINLGAPLGNIGGVVFFLIMLASIYYFSSKKKKELKK